VKFRIALLVFCLAFVTTEAEAAIKVLPSKYAITVASPQGSGDQIFDFSVNSTGIILVGTIENGLTNLVSSPTLGGSDGFASALDKNKAHLWDLRLGTVNDDIATAITRDKSGFFWIAGATSKPIETSTTAIDPTVINLDSVTVEPATPPTNSLNRLIVWKVSATGQLAATYFYDANRIIFPNAIAFDGVNFKITGEIAKGLAPEQFSISLDQSGTFSGLTTGKKPKPKAIGVETVKAGANNLKSFISKTTIIDIPSWRAKRPTPVIVKYTKSGKALAASSFAGKVRKVLWQQGIGAVVLVDTDLDYEVHVLTNMA